MFKELLIFTTAIVGAMLSLSPGSIDIGGGDRSALMTAQPMAGRAHPAPVRMPDQCVATTAAGGCISLVAGALRSQRDSAMND
jgi:hypothetical protein